MGTKILDICFTIKGQLALFLRALCFILIFASFLSCNGTKKPLATGVSLGPSVIGENGTRIDGADFGKIYTVTNIIESSSDIPEWSDADLPFAGPRRQLGQSFTDSQWPFKFTYSYPANNYKLNEAHLVIVTSRDNSDTEAIFIDGVVTGRPPSNQVSTTSTKVDHRYYSCSGVCGGVTTPSTPANTYFMDWALTHYKIATANSFDLNLSSLLTPTSLTPVDIIKDGTLYVVTGDDSVVRDNTATSSKPLLLLEGFTISKEALSCVNSSTYKFINTYIHNDGNSINQASFSGTVLPPSQSWSSTWSGFRSVDFYYDPRLPRISSLNNLNLSKAQLAMQVKQSTGSSAIVINGIGVAESGFDKSTASSAVETWDDSAVTYWQNFVSTIPTNQSAQTATLDLIALLGQNKVKELLAQGKLNVAIAGTLATVYGQGATNTRTYGVSVNGPELILEGSYFTEVCSVPDNPSSPLSDSSGSVSSCDLDSSSPSTSSIQVVSITSTSATVQWLTHEPATSQVVYGLASPSTATTLDSNLSTFHSVQITGLQPYKYYQYSLRTTDNCGNLTISNTQMFRTLR